MSSSNSRTAVVTGATSGLGKVFALQLAAAGFNLALADREPADAIVAEIIEHGGTAWAQCCDLANPAAVSGFAEAVLARFGRCDVLVNNAAFTPLRSLAETDLDTWRRTLAVNMNAAFLLSQAFTPGMAERRWGRIVNMTSSNTGRPQKGFFAYIASKGGVIGLTRALAA